MNTGQGIGLKTPSSGLSNKTPSAGILKDKDDRFEFSDIDGLDFHLEPIGLDDGVTILDTPPNVLGMIDRVGLSEFVIQETVADQPAHEGPGGGFLTHDGIIFDTFAGNHHLRTQPLTSYFITGTSGLVIYVCNPVPLVDGEWLWSQGFETLADVVMGLRLRDVGAGVFKAAFQHQSFGTANVVVGDSVIAPGEPVIIEVSSHGTGYNMRVNNTAQILTVESGVNNGNWADDLLARTYFALNQRCRDGGSGGNEDGALQIKGLMLGYARASLQVAERIAIYRKIKQKFPEVSIAGI